MWWHPDQFAKKREALKVRAETIRALRCFFDEQNFWPVETPALQACPGTEVHIHALRTSLNDYALNPVRDVYLHTSPELAMKKLLVAGAGKIYQICPVYRNGECTPLHNPEFTMLEWYRAGADYTDIMQDCADLLRHVAGTLQITRFTYKDKSCDPFLPIEKLSVTDAFKTYAGLDLKPLLDDTEAFATAVQALGIRTAPDDAWDDLFHRVMAEKIEPHLGLKRPCILYDYPASMAALARRKPNDPAFAERFELYVCGVELANAYGELTDAAEQAQRFESDRLEKQKIYGESYPGDDDFIRALEYGMPESSGIALGVDRLVMLAAGATHIEQVLWTAPLA